MKTIHALLTCFNRRDKTLACLEALQHSALPPEHRLRVLLVDDGSTDGTAEVVMARFPEVDLVRSDGGLFWCRGMHQAMAIAMREKPAYLLWVNDDVVPEPGAIARLIAIRDDYVARGLGDAIVVGATENPDTGRPSYGAHTSRGGLHRLTYDLAWHPDRVLQADAMNGNFVLIPHDIVARIGLIDPFYEHAMGDTDYALRARRAGFSVLAAPGFVGRCRNNPSQGTWSDPSLPLSRRLHLMLDRKGLPWRSWWHFTHAHGGLLGPLHFAWPYAKLVASGLRGGGARGPVSTDSAKG